MSDRVIGRIISVDSFRVLIELDSNLKGLHKNSYHGLYEIAKINSYIVIPVNDEKIVALVTRVKVTDETEIESFSGIINLPKSKRYIVATMIGTISGNNDDLECKGKQEYLQGVYNFPILDNPVWYVMEQELEVIFDYNKNKKIDFEKDYYLPIGTSPVFNDFEIKINPDKFFCTHAAILGNTGSGKSCTVSTILQSLLNFKFSEDEYINNANIIILDTNGEYKSAFNFSNKITNDRVNAFTIEEEGIKVPFWFMNYDDFDYLFKPSANTQAPILKRAIELAKNNDEAEEKKVFPLIIENTVNQIIDLCQKNDKSNNDELLKIIYEEVENLKNVPELESIFSFDKNEYVKRNEGRGNNAGRFFFNNSTKIMDISFKSDISDKLKKVLEDNNKEVEKVKIRQESNIDLPINFNFEELIGMYIDKAIEEQNTNNNRLNEFLSTLRLRLRGHFSDERFNKPFMLRENEGKNLLSEFIQYLMGVLTKADEKNIFSNYKFEKTDDKYSNIINEDKNQVTIIDMSLLSYEVLENITGLIGRIILEFLSRLDKAGIPRGRYPTVIVLEEAQNYIPEKDRDSERISISKRVFERIAREGRKFGLSLIVSSQRPSELSKTVLSQCNTFIVHRLQNPEDQRYIKQIVSSANEDILNQLPILPQQHAIIMGDAVRSPVQIKLRDVEPEPRSKNPEYVRQWLDKSKKLKKEAIDKVVEKWIGN